MHFINTNFKHSLNFMDLYLRHHHQFKSCFFTASFFKDALVISRKSTSPTESVDIFRFVNLPVLNVIVLFREMCRLRKEILTHKLEIHNEIILINTSKFVLIK